MAIGKTASRLITAGLMWAFEMSAGAAEFPARHEHWRQGCTGEMKVDETGVSFHGRKGTPGTGDSRTFRNFVWRREVFIY